MQFHHPSIRLENYCSEIASPVRSKDNISQRKLYLLSLVDKYYNQVVDLPQLQSQWFDRPIIKYQKWRAQELINWIRTAKRIIRTNRIKKKDLTENSKKNDVYTVLDNMTEANFPYNSPHLNRRRIRKIEQPAYL